MPSHNLTAKPNGSSGLWLHKFILISVVLLLALPIVATFIYSISTQWGATVLPDALSIKWYLQLWQDPRFLYAFGRSLLICFSTLLVSTLIILPMAFAVFYRFPKLKGLMDLLIILPFAIPLWCHRWVYYKYLLMSHLCWLVRHGY